jgi:4-hydroxy-tetrahydrodipicolinate reductase
MGRAVAETAAADAGFQLRALVTRDPARLQGQGPVTSDLAGTVRSGDVVVEFTAPAAAVEIARVCAERGAGLVSGTTGLDAAQDEAIRNAARRVPVLRAANFSLGVLALRRALAGALELLPQWDVEIVERHHRGKQDSPSGTALQLAREVGDVRGNAEAPLRHGRQGRTGTRPAAEIGIHALRGGTWVGDHTVVLAGPGEWIELRHVAQDRSAFAHGALDAARFVSTAPPGFYTLDDVARAAAHSS